jgi:hypothetical protein
MLLVFYIPRAGVTWAHVACIGMGSRQGGSGIRTEEYIGISFLFFLFLGRCITVVVSRFFSRCTLGFEDQPAVNRLILLCK